MDTSLASEFPHDNPKLGSGAAWVCTSPRGRALALRRTLVRVTPCLVMPEGAALPPGVVLAPAPEPPAVAEPSVPVLAPPAVAVVPLPSLTALAEPAKAQEVDAFAAFVRALVDSSLASGATRAAAVIASLLEEGNLTAGALPDETIEVLRKRGVLAKQGFSVSETFAATSRAWREVLRGTKNDLSECGASTLDSWAAELLCALAAEPKTRAGDHRRELRRRGVAAFGLLAA